MKKVFGFIIILIPAVFLIFFLHTGLAIRSDVSTFQGILFSLALTLAVIKPKIRKYLLLLSAILTIGMAPLFILQIIDWADILGSTGLGFILLLLFTYLPDFVKKGYIEKL